MLPKANAAPPFILLRTEVLCKPQRHSQKEDGLQVQEYRNHE